MKPFVDLVWPLNIIASCILYYVCMCGWAEVVCAFVCVWGGGRLEFCVHWYVQGAAERLCAEASSIERASVQTPSQQWMIVLS